MYSKCIFSKIKISHSIFFKLSSLNLTIYLLNDDEEFAPYHKLHQSH